MTLDQSIQQLAEDTAAFATKILFTRAPITEAERAFFEPVVAPVREFGRAVEETQRRFGRIDRRSRDVVQAIEALLRELFGS